MLYFSFVIYFCLYAVSLGFHSILFYQTIGAAHLNKPRIEVSLIENLHRKSKETRRFTSKLIVSLTSNLRIFKRL